MKKSVSLCFLIILSVLFGYVAFNMTGTSYFGIGETIVGLAEKTKALNVVTAVVFDFRGYDTIGESFVLFTAITASAAILRKPVSHRKKRGVK